MAIGYHGKRKRLYSGSGSTAVQWHSPTSPVLGDVNIEQIATLKPETLSGPDLVFTFGIKADLRVNLDRVLIEDAGNVRRFTDWWARLSATTNADIGQFVMTWGNNVVWCRGMLRGSTAVSLPHDDLASISGPLRAEETWAGDAGDEVTLDQDNKTPPRAAEVVWAPVDGEGGLVLLTEEREGVIDLELQRKRGSAAWVDIADADSVLLPTNATPGSAVSLDSAIAAVSGGLQKDDRLRVQYDSSSPTQYKWRGRLAMCAPLSLD